MHESVHAPHPVKQPNLTRKFPLTDMPTGLMAALVTRLADHLPRFVGSSDEFAVPEPRASADRATRWGALTARQRAWADSMSLKAIATPAAREPGPLVTRWRSRTVAKVDSIKGRTLCREPIAYL
jgi:hypothetical protein